MTEPLKDRACGRWRGILPALGVPQTFLTGKHQPCPVCGGTDRARFDDKGGNGTWICSHCGAGDGTKLVMMINGWDFKEAASRIEGIIGAIPKDRPRQERGDDEKRRAMNALWRSSGPIAEQDPVWRYLNSRIGMSTFPACLRTAMHLRYQADQGVAATHHPAMIAMLTDSDGRPVNLHRTYLTKDGRKAEVPDPRRMMPGSIPKGSAVRLTPAAETLGIAEGIETALSATQLFEVPCWSAINADRLSEWIPPAITRRIIVFGDNDVSFTGQAAAFALARRARVAGIEVQVEIPPNPNTDWNDVLLERKQAA